jgi:nicotinamidase-related amidase
VIFVCDSHIPNDPEFKQFGPHCVAGTREAEIVPGLP